MKLVRILARLALLSLAAATFIKLTQVYGDSVRPPLHTPRYRAWHQHRPSAPQIGQFLELIPAGLAVAAFAVGGRIVLRLRLTPPPRREGQPILLGLHRGRHDFPRSKDPKVDGRRSADSA